MSRTNLVIGSRASPLAVAQAEEVRGLLTGHDNTLHVSLLKLDTVGDRNLNVSLAELSRLESQTDTPPAAAAPSGHLVPPKPAGEKDLWTRELDAALHRGDAHVLVHSLKDLPTTGRTAFTLAAVPQRFDPYDALVLRADAPPPAGLPAAALVPADPNAVDDPQTQYAGVKIDLREVLPRGSVIGTSSLRRAAQLSHRYGDHFTFKVVRGNIATRLGKLDAPSGGYDALILAAAGLRRLGPDFASRISVRLRDERYAVGQGALGVEVAATDGSALALVQVACEDAGSRWRVEAERSVLRSLNGGCSLPLAIRSHYDTAPALGPAGSPAVMTLDAAVFSLDGKRSVEAALSRRVASNADAVALGVDLAAALNAQGAEEILAGIRATSVSDVLLPPPSSN